MLMKFGTAALVHGVFAVEKPNLVWFLTDDQDQLLGGSFPIKDGATPMPKTKRLMQDAGAYAENWYIHTPICSPSRSELFTGRYFHNVKMTGEAEMHVNYTKVNANTFVRRLKEEAGYATGMFGKYLNKMPKDVPPGFDAWMANGGGDYIAPAFQTKNIDGLPDGNYKFPEENYTTAVVGNVSIAWIKKVAKEGKPFLAYIAPKAAHEPFTPPVWYAEHWDSSWPTTEPREKNWNCSAELRANHHGLIPENPLISSEAANTITGIFKNRWRTLMAVDDVIAEVIETVDELGLLNSTYFFYSTDHGFQLGQFNILMDKRHVYEWDTKIHLLARGPGIKPGSSLSAPGTQVDIAPTLLGLAGLSGDDLDGRSVAPLLLDASEELPASTSRHLSELGNVEMYRQSWRQEVFLEYYFVAYNTKCLTGDITPAQYPQGDSWCALNNNTECWSTLGDEPSKNATCYTTEDPSNNFIALRRFEHGKGTLYAEFQAGNLNDNPIDFDQIDFVEHYHVERDPHQLNNLAVLDPLGSNERQELHNRLRQWLSCEGRSCHQVGHESVALV